MPTALDHLQVFVHVLPLYGKILREPISSARAFSAGQVFGSKYYASSEPMRYVIEYNREDNSWHATCTLFPELRHVHDDPRSALAGLFALFDAMVEDEHSHGAN